MLRFKVSESAFVCKYAKISIYDGIVALESASGYQILQKSFSLWTSWLDLPLADNHTSLWTALLNDGKGL